MSDEAAAKFSDLELEFRSELKGSGSLSPYITNNSADAGGGNSYVGFDIHPEDVEALYFEGIGIPRWESIKAESVEEQEKLYMQDYNELMSKYPMIGRANDTEQRAVYNSGEVSALVEECDRILAGTSNPKAVRALQKFILSGTKAAEKQSGLELNPRLDPNT